MAIDDQDVHCAIADGQFHPYFQPLVLFSTGQLQGFEILARWCHPERGWVAPDDFIPAAEHDGWIDSVTEQLLAKTLSNPSLLNSKLFISLNISPVQLHGKALPALIQSAAQLSQFPLDRLIIEITENALLHDIQHARAIVYALKDMGCKLALDDFGTGYSSLRHLQSLPFDELKVDRSFVNSMTEQRESRKIVAAVVGLGQSLGLSTVAEGVETTDQAEMLLWLGCELGQGWLFGKPVPIGELDAVISVNRPAIAPDRAQFQGRISLTNLASPPGERLAQLQAVYDGAPVGLAFLDRNLRYLSLNRRLADMNREPIEQHIGRTAKEMIPGLFPTVEPYLRRALKGEAIAGVQVTKPASGPYPEKTILLSYEPARDEAGEVLGVSVSVVDITELKFAEDARRETDEHFRSLMELMPLIPWIIDNEGRALDVSQRWLELTGMNDDQWKGLGWLDALHPDDVQPTLDVINDSCRSGRPIDVTYRVRQPNAKWKRLRSRGSARYGPDGKIICWYGALQDLDEPS